MRLKPFIMIPPSQARCGKRGGYALFSLLILVVMVLFAVSSAQPGPDPAHAEARLLQNPTATSLPADALHIAQAPAQSPTYTYTAPPTATARPSFTPSPQPPTSTPTTGPGSEFDAQGEPRDHYWLVRPFPRDPGGRIVDYAARSYPYGSTGGGGLQTHHGLDFQNLRGTSILATGSGTVFYAGSDAQVLFGPTSNFYGNLVVVQHDFVAPDGRAVYTLYGHMDQVDVQMGQRVELLDKLGEVGATGVALGSHLHLEVRLGDPYDYASTYNPDLWIRPWPGFGTLAGRIYDNQGQRLYDTRIDLQMVGGGVPRLTFSYADDLVNPDPYYGETFTYGDLPAGEYQVVVRLRNVVRYKGTVLVEEGQTSWIEIRLN